MKLQLAAIFLLFSLTANAQTLTGAIDMHAHADPDGVGRKLDAIDLVRLAKDRGMRAIVIKNFFVFFSVFFFFLLLLLFCCFLFLLLVL